jgi:hypothetical protein
MVLTSAHKRTMPISRAGPITTDLCSLRNFSSAIGWEDQAMNRFAKTDLNSIQPKGILDRREFGVPAQPECEASLYPAEKSDRICCA